MSDLERHLANRVTELEATIEAMSCYLSAYNNECQEHSKTKEALHREMAAHMQIAGDFLRLRDNFQPIERLGRLEVEVDRLGSILASSEAYRDKALAEDAQAAGPMAIMATRKNVGDSLASLCPDMTEDQQHAIIEHFDRHLAKAQEHADSWRDRAIKEPLL